MQDNQNELRAALERAAATMRAATPNAQVANRFGEMTPPGLPGWVSMSDFSMPSAKGFGGSQPQNAMAYAPPDPNKGNMTVPLPMARPASAPQAPASDGGMSFFTRNAMMMQDPATGQYIDPTGAAKAQSAPQQDQGSLIQKMLGRLTDAATPGTNGNGSIAGASGPTSVGGAPLQSAPYPGANAGILSKAAWYLNGN